MARVRQVGLFSRRIVENLSVAGFEALLAGASLLSEGQVSRDGSFYGSTMVTLDLRQLSGRVRDTCDLKTANRLAQQMADDTQVLERLRKVARKEAERVADCALDALQADVRVRSEGCWVFVDIDIEATAAARAAQDVG